MEKIKKEQIKKILQLYYDGKQAIDFAIKTERKKNSVLIENNQASICYIDGYSELADTILSMKLDDAINRTNKTQEFLIDNITEYIYTHL